MENLSLSFNVVAPLMIYMLVGVLMRRTGLVQEEAFRGANNIVFYAGIPALCFRSIAVCDLSEIFDTPYLIYLALAILVLYAFAYLLVPRFCRDDRRRGVLVQALFRSNDAVFGLPVAIALLGEENLSLMALGIALCVPLFNTLGVIAMEHYRGGKASFGALALRILKNPVIISCIAGFAANLLNISLPDVLDTPLKGVASLAAPLAFILLGGTLSFRALHENRVALTIVCALRLIVIPALMIGVFLLLGFRGEPIVVALIVFGAPVALTTYSMAVAMNADDTLAGALVAVSSVSSILTTFLFIFALKELCFI